MVLLDYDTGNMNTYRQNQGYSLSVQGWHCSLHSADQSAGLAGIVRYTGFKFLLLEVFRTRTAIDSILGEPLRGYSFHYS